MLGESRGRPVDPLRRRGLRGVLRHGQAGAGTLDRACARAVKQLGKEGHHYSVAHRQHNFAITPWALLTPDIQVIRGARLCEKSLA